MLILYFIDIYLKSYLSNLYWFICVICTLLIYLCYLYCYWGGLCASQKCYWFICVICTFIQFIWWLFVFIDLHGCVSLLVFIKLYKQCVSLYFIDLPCVYIVFIEEICVICIYWLYLRRYLYLLIWSVLFVFTWRKSVLICIYWSYDTVLVSQIYPETLSVTICIYWFMQMLFVVYWCYLCHNLSIYWLYTEMLFVFHWFQPCVMLVLALIYLWIFVFIDVISNISWYWLTYYHKLFAIY